MHEQNHAKRDKTIVNGYFTCKQKLCPSFFLYINNNIIYKLVLKQCYKFYCATAGYIQIESFLKVGLLPHAIYLTIQILFTLTV